MSANKVINRLSSEAAYRGSAVIIYRKWFCPLPLRTVLFCSAFTISVPASAQVLSAEPQAALTGQQTSAGQVDAQVAIDDIIVTANKREQSLNRVPVSITAVSGDQLSKLGVNDVGDLVKVVPGLTFTQSNLGRPILTLRGIGFNATFASAAPTVSVYVDEVPLPYPVLSSGAGIDLSRVEVLKGPQGILFGQNATGGAINYIAAKPTSDLQAGVTVDYGRFSRFDGEAYVSGPLSGTLKGRVAIRTEQGGAWQRSYTQDLSLGDRNFTALRGILDWDPSSTFRAVLRVNGFRDRSENQAAQLISLDPSQPLGVLIANVPTLVTYPLSPRTSRAADWTGGQSLRRDNEFNQGSLRMEYSSDPAFILTSITSYGRYKEASLADYDGVSLLNNQMLSNTRIRTFGQEVRASGNPTPGVNYVVGVNYDRSRVSESTIVTLPQSSAAYAVRLATGNASLPPITQANPLGITKSETWAVFGNLEYEIAQGLKVSGGLRYTKHDIDFTACTRSTGDNSYGVSLTALANRLRDGLLGLPPISPILPGQCGTFDAQFNPVLTETGLNQDNISWRGSLDWTPVERTLVYASVTRGFKAGSFPSISTSQAEQYRAVSQEKVTAYEVGVKSTIVPGLLQFNAAAFHYGYDDKQILNAIPVAVFGQLSALINIPKSRVTGFEAEVVVTPANGLAINLSGNYIDSKIKNFSAFTQLGVLADQSGRPFPYTPKIQTVLGVNYERPIGTNHVIFANGNLNTQSRTYGSLEKETLFRVKGYGRLDLRLGVRTADDRYSLSIWGRNVTNTYYWTATNLSLDTVGRFTGAPATYGVTLGAKLN